MLLTHSKSRLYMKHAYIFFLFNAPLLYKTFVLKASVLALFSLCDMITAQSKREVKRQHDLVQYRFLMLTNGAIHYGRNLGCTRT